MFKKIKLTSRWLATPLFISLIGETTPILAQGYLDDLIVSLCQTSIQVKYAANQERGRVEMSFDSAEQSSVSNSSQEIRGTARVRTRNDWQPLSYNCVVRTSEGLVTQANYILKQEPSASTSSVRLCQQELRDVVRRDRDGLVDFDSSVETYNISRAEEGVRGTAMVQQSRQGRQRYRFDCTVNIREERVTRLTYSPEGSDRPTANDDRPIRLCQENVRQQVSGNQLDFGGIIGITLGTGRKIEFRESAETFYISDNQQGVRGGAVLLEGRNERPVSYQCTVNIREGTVTNVNLQ